MSCLDSQCVNGRVGLFIYVWPGVPFTTMSDLLIPTWTIGDRMRKARREAGLTADELADLLGVGKKSLSRWENGSMPKRMTLTAWAHHTGVPVEWLEFGDDGDDLPTGRHGDYRLLQAA